MSYVSNVSGEGKEQDWSCVWIDREAELNSPQCAMVTNLSSVDFGLWEVVLMAAKWKEEEEAPYSSAAPTLENPLYLFADDSTFCRTISHPSEQQAVASSLTTDLDKITN